MKTRSLLLAGPLLFWLTACEPKRPEKAVNHEPFEKAAMDSAMLTAPPDGTATAADTLPEPVPEPERAPAPKPAAPNLPEPLRQVLNKKHPGWKLPALPDLYNDLSQHRQINPYLVRGDWNGDGHEDYALQIQEKNMVRVLAFLTKEGGNPEEHLVTELPVFKNRGNAFSVFHLSVTKGGSTITHYGTGRKLTLPHDAISVGIEYATTTYLLQDGKFVDLPGGG